MQTPFVYRRPLRWGDTDAAMIVYTANYFDICMEAIEGWFINTLELDWFAMHLDLGVGTPFVHAEVDLHSPLTPRDVLTIRVDIERLGEKSLSFALEGSREQDGGPVFSGRFTCCFNDSESFKPTAIPAPMRERIAQYQHRSASSAAYDGR